MKKALIGGASGAVGRHLLTLLLNSNRYDKVISLARSPSGIQHGKLKECVVNFECLEQFALPYDVDDVYCCLGTTIKQAGSKKAFRRVDHDYTVALAELARKYGAQRAAVISSMGVESAWGGLYLNTKRDMENSLRGLSFYSLVIVRPGLLVGERSGFRAGESLGRLLLEPLSLLPFKATRQQKPIATTQVAKAMYQVMANAGQGAHTYDNLLLHEE